MEDDLRTVRLEQPHDIERGTLANVIDIRLVSDTNDEHAAAIHWLPLFVQRLRNLADDIGRHLTIDLAREIDEPRLVVQRAHLPREIVRVQWDAVSADARSRCELHE